MAKRQNPEHLLQIKLIERVRFELVPLFPVLRGPDFAETGALRLVAVPNGGLRAIQEGVRLKMEGVQEGFPDLFLPIPRGGHPGAALELKAPGGRVKPAQTSWLEFLHGQGYRVGVRWNVEDAFEFLADYMTLPAAATWAASATEPNNPAQ
jgi:hypothetical protein